MKKVIITGANGFLGTALCHSLLQENIEVIAVVRNSDSDISRLDRHEKIRIVDCSASNYSEIPEKILDRDVDVWYHLAWEGTAGPLRGDYSVQLGNVQSTCNAISACAKMQCKRFVFANSIMSYENACLNKQNIKPVASSIYSAAKLSADHVGRSVAAKYEIDYISAIISNIYGPGENSPRLINTSIRKLLGGERCSYSEAEQLYDFIYITDAVKAFYLIGNQGIPYKSYYIGNLKPRPLKEFLLELRDYVAPNAVIGIGDLHYEGISLTYTEFDASALYKDTGFVPQVAFKDGIDKTTEWIEGSSNADI